MHLRFSITLVVIGLAFIVIGYQRQHPKKRHLQKSPIVRGALISDKPEFEDIEGSATRTQTPSTSSTSSTSSTKVHTVSLPPETTPRTPVQEKPPLPEGIAPPLLSDPALSSVTPLEKNIPPLVEESPSTTTLTTSSNPPLSEESSSTNLMTATVPAPELPLSLEEALAQKNPPSGLPETGEASQTPPPPSTTTTLATKTTPPATTSFSLQHPSKLSEEEEVSEGKEKERKRVPYQKVSFTTLSGFDYRTSDSSIFGGGSSQDYTVPQHILDLHEKNVVIEGYMLPIHYREGKTKMFLLLGFQSGCCFGGIPRLNEWVVVTVKGEEGVKVLPSYQRCKIYGPLEVGEHKDEMDLESLYRMHTVKVKEIPLEEGPASDHESKIPPPEEVK
jgi:hypothetical protein